MKINAPRLPAQLGLLAGERQIDAAQSAADGIAQRLGDRRGHDAVAGPGGIEARVIQIKTVARSLRMCPRHYAARRTSAPGGYGGRGSAGARTRRGATPGWRTAACCR